MADNNLKIQADVEMPSARQINAQITALEKNIKKLKISGQFDTSALKDMTKQLDSIKASAQNTGKELDTQNSRLQDRLTKIGKDLEKLQNFTKKSGGLIKQISFPSHRRIQQRCVRFLNF